MLITMTNGTGPEIWVMRNDAPKQEEWVIAPQVRGRSFSMTVRLRKKLQRANSVPNRRTSVPCERATLAFYSEAEEG